MRIAGDEVYLLLPPKDQLDALLATNLHCVTACETHSKQAEEVLVAP